MRSPRISYQGKGTSRGNIISVKRKHWFNLVNIFFSNDYFPSRIYSDFLEQF